MHCKGGAAMSAGDWMTRELKASASGALQNHCKCQPLPKHARYQEPFKFNQCFAGRRLNQPVAHQSWISNYRNRKTQMNLLTIASAALIAVAGSTQAMADSGRTRAEVKAELAEAIRTGDIIASGESSYKRNELRPDLYPAVAKGPGSTREQVKAELAEAVRSGNIITVGETSLTQNQLFPDRYRSDTRTARGGGAISTQ
jgi:hypothetical protein